MVLNLLHSAAALKDSNTTKSMKRVPKGTSEYQAAWIIDSDHEDDPAVSLQQLAGHLLVSLF